MFLGLKAKGAESDLAGSRTGTELGNRRNKVAWIKGRERTDEHREHEHRESSIF